MKKAAAFLLIALGANTHSEAARFAFPIDVSQAPEDLPFARRARAVCEEWYPKLNGILFSPAHPLPYTRIPIVFDSPGDYPAYTRTVIDNGKAAVEIHIARDQRNRADSFEGMVVHELAHVVQNDPQLPEDQIWLGEGIADYIRHKYFEKDIAGKLTVGEDGVLRGYTAKSPFLFGLQRDRVDLRETGPLIGYTVAGEFLYWLERSKDAGIVHKLNAALSEGKYTPDVFSSNCGAPLDELWERFLLSGRE